MATKTKKKARKTKANPCETCKGLCCKYVALEIDEPTTKSDFDDIRWYLCHKNVWVFVDEGDWFVQFDTRCRYLGPDYRCRIYETRPKICRKYSTDNCELTGEGDPHEMAFKTPEEVEAYAKEYLAKKKKKKKKSGKKKK